VSEATETGASTFPLRGSRAPVALYATGLRHPGLFGRGEAFTPYGDLTHVVAGPRGIRIGTRRRVLLLRARDFAEPEGPARLAQALRARVAALPDGPERLARMARLDRRMADPGRRPLSRAAALACLAGFGLQIVFAPAVDMAGMFSADLVRAGEWWRLISANFLHGGPSHLLLNTLALFVLGDLLERQVRTAATALVMALSAVGAMTAGLLAGYVSALGASGVVAGIVAALLVLEIRRPALLPVGWRIPRGLLVGAVVAETLVLSFVPAVAHAAHVGGFLAGGAAALLLPPPEGRRRAPGWLRLADLAAAGLVVASLGMTAWTVAAPDAETVARRAERLLAFDDAPPVLLNNQAWRIATSEEATPELLELAGKLAQRAVEATDRRNPDLLDTLAEVYFQSGEHDRAVDVIDEAIALVPDEPYFREQRRRFTGDRDPADRPPPPDPGPRSPPEGPDGEDGPAIPERPRIEV